MHSVFMTAATPDRPAQLGRSDNQPKAYGRLEPRAAQVQGPSGVGSKATLKIYWQAAQGVRVPGAARRARAGPFRLRLRLTPKALTSCPRRTGAWSRAPRRCRALHRCADQQARQSTCTAAACTYCKGARRGFPGLAGLALCRLPQKLSGSHAEIRERCCGDSKLCRAYGSMG